MRYRFLVDFHRSVLPACLSRSTAGCGAIKVFGETTVEVKRMYVAPEYRNKGIASLVLTELEKLLR